MVKYIQITKRVGVMIYTNFREIDKAGRIVISKDIRNHLNIKPGDILLTTIDIILYHKQFHK